MGDGARAKGGPASPLGATPAVLEPTEPKPGSGTPSPSLFARLLPKDPDAFPTLVVALAPFVGLTVAYAYTILMWRGLGLVPGDLDLSLSTVAPSAGLLALSALVGWYFAYAWKRQGTAAWVVTIVLAGTFIAVASKGGSPSTALGGAVSQGYLVAAMAWGVTAGSHAKPVAKVIDERVSESRRESAHRLWRCAVVVAGFATVGLLATAVHEPRSYLEGGRVAQVSLLPMGAGPAVRYVTMTVLDDHLAGLGDAQCVVTFGKGGDGSLRLRLVRADGRVQLVAIEPGAVALTAAQPCSKDLRKAVWGPLRSAPATSAVSTTSSTTTSSTTASSTASPSSTTGP